MGNSSGNVGIVGSFIWAKCIVPAIRGFECIFFCAKTGSPVLAVVADSVPLESGVTDAEIDLPVRMLVAILFCTMRVRSLGGVSG